MLRNNQNIRILQSKATLNTAYVGVFGNLKEVVQMKFHQKNQMLQRHRASHMLIHKRHTAMFGSILGSTISINANRSMVVGLSD